MLLLSSFACAAMDVALALSHRGEAHIAFVESLHAALPRAAGFRLNDAGSLEGGLDEGILKRADIVVAVGPQAAEAVAARRTQPVLAVLVSAENLRGLQRRHPGAPVAGIVLDQPLERQMRLIRAVMPEVTHIGVLLGPQSAPVRSTLEAAAEQEGLFIHVEDVANENALLPTLERLLANTQAVLALPDPLTFSPGTARAILLTTYRHRRPLVGYSRAYVEAGALAAIYSAPADAARQVAEWLSGQDGRPVELPPTATPRYFRVALNSQVARALALPLPRETELATAIDERENP